MGESEGQTFNLDRGNQSEVLAKEKVFHHFLDQAGYRWQPDKRNELFQATPEKLVAELRKVQGLQMVLFDKQDWREDPLYTGGNATQPIPIVEVDGARQQAARETKAPTVHVQLTKSAIEQLRSGKITQYTRLVNLIMEVAGLVRKDAPRSPRVKIEKDDDDDGDDDGDDEGDDDTGATGDTGDDTGDAPEPAVPTTVRVPRNTVRAIRQTANVVTRAQAAADIVASVRMALPPPARRVTRSQTRAATAPRRSARLARR